MGTIIKASMLNKDLMKNTTAPIIFCSFQNRMVRLMEGCQYTPLNLNIRLAEELVKYPAEQRPRMANDEVMLIASKCDAPMILEDYDILFDPRYGIDAVKVFTELARRQRVVVKWIGKLNGNSLEYANPEYKDFHSFRIQDYDITCVK